MGSCPGASRTSRRAAARLGLRTGLVAGFGDDAYGDWMWDTLQGQEKIDLTASRRFDSFHSAITVSMAFHGDRGMVTHAHPLPESLEPNYLSAPRAKAATVDLATDGSWWHTMKERGTLLFADVGFDRLASGTKRSCSA